MCERVESADDVVAIDAEIEREMVTGPGRHAHVRESPLGGDRGDDRLRPIAARHADGVRAVLDRVTHKRRKVVTEMQLHRLDATRACLARDLEALRFPAARFRVVEQHRPLRRRRDRQRGVDGEHPPRSCEREHDPREDQHVLEHAALEQDQHDRADEQHGSAHRRGVAHSAFVNQRPPCRQHGEHQAREHRHTTREPVDRHDDRQDERRREQSERRDRG